MVMDFTSILPPQSGAGALKLIVTIPVTCHVAAHITVLCDSSYKVRKYKLYRYPGRSIDHSINTAPKSKPYVSL